MFEHSKTTKEGRFASKNVVRLRSRLIKAPDDGDLLLWEMTINNGEPQYYTHGTADDGGMCMALQAAKEQVEHYRCFVDLQYDEALSVEECPCETCRKYGTKTDSICHGCKVPGYAGYVKATPCRWKYDNAECCWKTGCKNRHEAYTSTSPGRYGMSWCPYCGERIEEVFG